MAAAPPDRPYPNHSSATKCINRPGIPTAAKVYEMHWAKSWCVAFLLLPGLIYYAFQWAYSTTKIELPDGLLNLDLHSAGCDIIVERCAASRPYARLGYWRNMYIRGAGMTLDTKNHTLVVDMEVARRAQTFQCSMRVCLSSNNRKQYEFNSLKISMVPSYHAQFSPQPSNTAELVVMSLIDFSVKEAIGINLTAATDSVLQGINAKSLDVSTSGGIFRVTDSPLRNEKWMEADEPGQADAALDTARNFPQDITVKASDTSLVFTVNYHKVQAIMDNVTLDTAVISGAAGTSASVPGGTTKHLLSPAKGNSSQVPEGYSTINLYSRHGASYIMVADQEHMTAKAKKADGTGDQCALSLDTFRGGRMVYSHGYVGGVEKSGSLLRDGVQSLENLNDWLKTQAQGKFVVYLSLVHPYAPAGTLRLLSTSAYKAFSLPIFAMVSAGMLTPQIVRIETPVLGFDFLFPRRPSCDGDLTEEENLKWSNGIFTSVIQHVDILALGLSNARWIWDPLGPAKYIFEHIPAKRGQSAMWVQRLLTTQDTLLFSVAAVITFGLGLMLGVVLVYLAFDILYPHLRRKIRRVALGNSASYRLIHSVASSDWAIASCLVSYPKSGVMLRWNKRDQAAQFQTLSISARTWPVKDDKGSVHVYKIDPARIPTHPQIPGQQMFLFAVDGPKTPVMEEIYKDPMDQQLWGTWTLRANQKSLEFGVPYQFRVTAHGAGNKIIEKSDFSRPTMIRGYPPVTEFPMLLWKALKPMVPSDTFKFFLDQYCLPVTTPPSLILQLSNIKIALVNGTGAGESTLFGGALDLTYGDEDDYQYVKIMASTGGEVQTSEDQLYVQSSMVELPPASKRGPGTAYPVCSAEEAIPGGTPGFHRASKAKWIVMDINKRWNKIKGEWEPGQEQTMEMQIGADLTQTVRLEVALINSQGQQPDTAKVDKTWENLLAAATSSIPGSKDRKDEVSVGRLTNHVVMRDALLPAAILMADVRFTNTFIKSPKPAKYFVDALPEMFGNMYPGRTYQWGQVIILSWDLENMPESAPKDQYVDVVLVSHKVDVDGSYSNLPPDLMKTVKKEQVVIRERLTMSAGKATFGMCPNQPHFLQKMTTRIEIRECVDPDSNSIGKVLATGPEVLVDRPVTMQNVELAYAAFCIRNNIAQMPLPNSTFTNHGVNVQEREFFVVQGHRQMIPTPAEMDKMRKHKNDRGIIVKDPASSMISSQHPIELEDATEAPRIEVPFLQQLGLLKPEEDPAAPAAPAEGLQAPLLQTEAPSAAKQSSGQLSIGPTASVRLPTAQEVEKHQILTPARVTMDVPTNLFWKYDADWSEDLLLWYSMLPNFACEGYLYDWLSSYGWDRLANGSKWVDNVFRIILKVLLWEFQFLALAVPFLIFLVLLIWHDYLYAQVSPNVDPALNVGDIHVSDYIISPSIYRYSRLDGEGRVIVIFGLFYIALVLLATVFCNFFHHEQKYAKGVEFMFPFLNGAMGGVYGTMVFILIVWAAVVMVWIILGAMIDPMKLLPYATFLIAVIILVKSQWGNLQMMKDHVESKMSEFGDLVLHAIVSVFVGDGVSGPWLDMQAQSALSAQVTELVRVAEQATTKALLEAAPNIKMSTDLFTVARYKLLRSSAAFAEGVASTKDQAFATDFVPAEVLPLAQSIANEQATINNTRAAADPVTGAVPDNDVDDIALSKGLAQLAEQNVPAPGQITADERANLDQISTDLKLRSETCTLLSQAFTLATHLQTTAGEKSLLDPTLCSTFMANVRQHQLYDHFMDKEEGEGAAKKKTSTAKKMLAELQNQEMETYLGKMATALTTMCDWTAISRTISHFSGSYLPETIINRAVDEQLNQYVAGSAAFEMMLRVYNFSFKKFEEYEHDPLEFFVDVGIISRHVRNVPACASIISAALTGQQYTYGNTPDALIATAKYLVLPSLRAVEDSGDVPQPLYLWFGAFKRILEELGFTEEETELMWLAKQWKIMTEGKALFDYRDVSEVNALISSIADDGLWRSAAKRMMLGVKIVGYASCFSSRYPADDPDRFKKIAKDAHALQVANQDNLLWLRDNCPWPDDIEESWKRHCVPRETNEGEFTGLKGPLFLPQFKLLDFLQDVVFVEKETAKKSMLPKEFAKGVPVTIKEGKGLEKYNGLSGVCEDFDPATKQWNVTLETKEKKAFDATSMEIEVFTQMNAYPSDALDLQWYMTKNQAVWQQLPTEKRMLRGIWLEVVLEAFNSLDCCPTDLDLFYGTLTWQTENFDKFPAQYISSRDVKCCVRLDALQKWLTEVYLPSHAETCSFGQFSSLLKERLNCTIPPDVLKAEVFTKCPLVPDDDLAELRYVNDLAAGLRLWMGYGLWQEGVGQLLGYVMPRGPLRNMAMRALPSEFAKVDTQAKGVVQPAQAIVLIHKLAHPGLTCDELSSTVHNHLGLDVDPREFHHYFAQMDVNCDNVMNVNEFIPFLRLLLVDYFPGKIMEAMSLSSRKIVFFVSNIVMVIAFLFVCVTLVITTFTSGTAVGSSIHSGVTALSAAGAKIQGESTAGFNDAVSAVKASLEKLLMDNITLVLGLSPPCIDAFSKLVAGLATPVAAAVGITSSSDPAAAATATAAAAATGAAAAAATSS